MNFWINIIKNDFSATRIFHYACYVNEDNVNSHYYTQEIQTSSSSASGVRVNSSRAFVIDASFNSFGILDVSLRNSYAMILGKYRRGGLSTPILSSFSIHKTSIVSNITQLTFTASVANSIGVGSKIIIRRKDK